VPKITIAKGTTSKRLSLFIQDSSSTTGAGLTGLLFNTASLTAYYYREGAASATSITLATATVGTYTSGGFKEIDATNMPGFYFFCPPDAALASGANSVSILLKGAANMAPLPLEIELSALDNQDSVRGGITALPNAAAGATGGLDCAVAFGGTASAGAANSITLAGASATDNIYNHQIIQITGGTGVGQARTITAYNGTTKVAIVSRGWRTNPDNTSVYQIKGFDFQPSTSVVGGFAQAATSTTVTLPATGSAVDSYYNGAVLAVTGGTAVGQTRIITAYNGTTKVATVSRAFQTTPDTTSVVIVFQASQPRLDANMAVDVANVNTSAIINNSFAVDSITSGALSTGAATEIAGAVWDEARTSHTTAGSFGQGVASVQGNVTGSVGSVTGAVGSVGAGGITSASFAAAAITATAIATDAITANKVADGTIDALTFAAGAINATAIASDAITANKIADGAIDAATFAVDSITSAAITNGATAEIAAAVWDLAISGHTTAGTTGEALSAAGTAGDPWTTALPGAYSAGTAGKILGDNLDAAISTRATPAQVNTEVVDALATDTYAEPAAVPAATASLADKIGFLMALARNKITQTATTQTLRNSTDSASIGVSTDSDDGTTFTRGGFV